MQASTFTWDLGELKVDLLPGDQFCVRDQDQKVTEVARRNVFGWVDASHLRDLRTFQIRRLYQELKPTVSRVLDQIVFGVVVFESEGTVVAGYCEKKGYRSFQLLWAALHAGQLVHLKSDHVLGLSDLFTECFPPLKLESRARQLHQIYQIEFKPQAETLVFHSNHRRLRVKVKDFTNPSAPILNVSLPMISTVNELLAINYAALSNSSDSQPYQLCGEAIFEFKKMKIHPGHLLIEYGIHNDSVIKRMVAKRRAFLRGAVAPFSFSTLRKCSRRHRTRPEYAGIASGLNFRIQCRAGTCSRITWARMHYGDFQIPEALDDLWCRRCLWPVDVMGCAFTNCRFFIEGKKSEESRIWKSDGVVSATRVFEFKSRREPLCKWSWLEIEVRPISPRQPCRLRSGASPSPVSLKRKRG